MHTNSFKPHCHWACVHGADTFGLIAIEKTEWNGAASNLSMAGRKKGDGVEITRFYPFRGILGI